MILSKFLRIALFSTGALAATSPSNPYYPTIFDYGALCNGSHDDGPAVQSALNGNKIVHVPAGPNYCMINTPVSIPTGASLVADAAGVNFNGAANCFRTSSSIDMFSLAGGDVTLRGVCFQHDGASGHIIIDNGLKLGGNVFEDVGFTATNNSNVSDIVYFNSSNNAVRGGGFTNLRTNAFAIRFDATGGVVNIGNHIESSTFGGSHANNAGSGIVAGSSDATARQEGLFVKNNFFVLQGGSNLWLDAVLSAHVEGNEFDQAWGNNVVINPSSSKAVSDVSFVNNWFSTPNQQSTGVCVEQLTTTNPVSNVSFVGNHFSWCGYGASFGTNAQGISFTDNVFTAMGQAALAFNGTANVIISSNNFSNLGGAGRYNLLLTDGAAGGPFSVVGNHFDSSSSVEFTETSPQKFTFDQTNTGLKFAGMASGTYSITSCNSQYFYVPHGLAGTPQLGRIITSIVSAPKNAAQIGSPTLYIISADATNVLVNFQCGLFVQGGNVQINVDASL